VLGSPDGTISIENFKAYLIDKIVERGVDYVATLIRNLTNGAEKYWVKKQNAGKGETLTTETANTMAEELSFDENALAEERFAELLNAEGNTVKVSSLAPHLQEALQLSQAGVVTRKEFILALRAFKQRRTPRVLNFLLVWLEGTSAEGFRGLPEVPDGVITLYTQLERLSGRQSYVSQQAVATARPGPESIAMFREMDHDDDGKVGLREFCLYFLAQVVGSSVMEAHHVVEEMTTFCTEAIEKAKAAEQEKSPMREQDESAISAMNPAAKELFTKLDAGAPGNRGGFMRTTLEKATKASSPALQKSMDTLVPDDDGNVSAVAFLEWADGSLPEELGAATALAALEEWGKQVGAHWIERQQARGDLRDILPGGVAALCSVLDTDDSGCLSKEEFTQVQESDFGLFERIGPNANGEVTLERFTEFMLDAITEEGPTVTAKLILELREGADKRFAAEEANKKYDEDLEEGRELYPEEKELAQELFTALEEKLGGATARQNLELERAEPLLLQEFVSYSRKRVKLEEGAFLSRNEWLEALTLFKQDKGIRIFGYYLEWLRGTHLGFGQGAPSTVPPGVLAVFTMLEKLSQANGNAREGFTKADLMAASPNLGPIAGKQFEAMDLNADRIVDCNEFCLFYLGKAVARSENYVGRMLYQLREGALNIQMALEMKQSDEKKAQRNAEATIAKMTGDASELFCLLDYEGEGQFTKADYVAAAKGDFGVFETMQPDRLGYVSAEGFYQWAQRAIQDKGQEKAATLFQVLLEGARLYKEERAAAEVDLQSIMPGGMRALCALIDTNNDGEITKDELVSAHDGDFGLFEDCNPTVMNHPSGPLCPSGNQLTPPTDLRPLVCCLVLTSLSFAPHVLAVPPLSL